MLNAQHLSLSNEHYTPTDFIEAARTVMGRIHLDPASTASVNEHLVKATDFFTKEDDGLGKEWWGNVWLNPPGGMIRGKDLDICSRSRAVVWWNKLVEEYEADRVEQAIFLGFSIEILSSSQSAKRSVLEFPICVPHGRIDFLKEVESGVFKGQGAPGHANVFAYLPPKDDNGEAVLRFANEFSKFGIVR